MCRELHAEYSPCAGKTCAEMCRPRLDLIFHSYHGCMMTAVMPETKVLLA